MIVKTEQVDILYKHELGMDFYYSRVIFFLYFSLRF